MDHFNQLTQRLAYTHTHTHAHTHAHQNKHTHTTHIVCVCMRNGSKEKLYKTQKAKKRVT